MEWKGNRSVVKSLTPSDVVLQVLKPHMERVLTLAKTEIAYDPNLADTGDVDMEDSDQEDYDDGDDGGEYDDDEYNDDEDTSWKVRRAACLLVVALVAAYPERSAALYSQCRPTLQARFKEREESVKLDVFVAYSALVRQRGATASDEERKQLAADASEDTSALVKQLRATRSAKLKVRVLEEQLLLYVLDLLVVSFGTVLTSC
jgi:hypothetical protein